MPATSPQELSACCKQTVTIYRLQPQEGSTLKCIWCTRTLLFHAGKWEREEDA